MAKKKSARPSGFEKWFAKLQFGFKERKALYNQLMAQIETGMAVTEALQMSWDVASYEGAKPKELNAIILVEVIREMKNGEPLSHALRPWVPAEDVMVFEAIENSEDFAGNLRDYLDMLERKKKIKGTILGGMAYPVLLFGMVYFIMAYFGSSVVPQIAQMLPMEQWTGPASFLAFMNRFAESYAIPGIAVLIGAIVLIVLSLSRWSGAGRAFADKLPIYSTYRMYTGISFLLSVASLIKSGTPAPDALERLYPEANPYVKKRIVAILRQMRNGANLGAAMHRAGTGWPDPKMNLNIKIFAETKDLSSQLSKLAKGWLENSQEQIARNMGLFRTVAMLMVFMTIMGIVGGTYSLQDQIANSVNR